MYFADTAEQVTRNREVLFTDERIVGLRFAQACTVPHLSISPGIIKISFKVAVYIHSPATAPVVLGME